MKIVLDSCIPKTLQDTLIEAGYDTEWVGNYPMDPGDNIIIQQAYLEIRILITLDKDFGELAIVHNFPHYGIIRITDFSVNRQIEICLSILDRYVSDLISGAIITAEPGRIRIRPSSG